MNMKAVYILALSFVLIHVSCMGQIKFTGSFRNELLACFHPLSDTQYVEDRRKLERISISSATDSSAILYHKTANSGRISIKIKSKRFDSAKHHMHLCDTVFKEQHGRKVIDHLACVGLIDDHQVYGLICDYPRDEIKFIKIKWNTIRLTIPDSAFWGLYDIHCQSIRAYQSSNRNLYIYLSGSDGAGSYGVKLVFDRHRYITRIITSIECMDSADFLDGHGSCE